MDRADMDRMADEHFDYEAADDIEGVLATLTDDATHHLVGSPLGERRGQAEIRAFSGRATTRLLHVFEFREGRIAREQVWPDTVAIERALR